MQDSPLLRDPNHPFAKLARELSRELEREKELAPSTLWRWATKGLRGIKLEYLRVGGTMVSSREALNRFFVKLSAQDRKDASTAPQGESSEVEQELDALGIG